MLFPINLDSLCFPSARVFVHLCIYTLMGIPKFIRIAATQRYFWLNIWYFMLEKLKAPILESEISQKSYRSKILFVEFAK